MIGKCGHSFHMVSFILSYPILFHELKSNSTQFPSSTNTHTHTHTKPNNNLPYPPSPPKTHSVPPTLKHFEEKKTKKLTFLPYYPPHPSPSPSPSPFLPFRDPSLSLSPGGRGIGLGWVGGRAVGIWGGPGVY